MSICVLFRNQNHKMDLKIGTKVFPEGGRFFGGFGPVNRPIRVGGPKEVKIIWFNTQFYFG